MLMSQGARSLGEIGCPKAGVSAATAGALNVSAAPSATVLSEHIARLPLLVDAPAGDRAVMVLAAQPALRDEGRTRLLHRAGLVGGAALQHRRTTVPLPGGAEAGDRLRQ